MKLDSALELAVLFDSLLPAWLFLILFSLNHLIEVLCVGEGLVVQSDFLQVHIDVVNFNCVLSDLVHVLEQLVLLVFD